MYSLHPWRKSEDRRPAADHRFPYKLVNVRSLSGFANQADIACSTKEGSKGGREGGDTRMVWRLGPYCWPILRFAAVVAAAAADDDDDDDELLLAP